MNAAPPSHQLAVIVPAFKGKFLSRVFECLLQQTDQRFSIYVCDDASPADIASIAKSALGTRPYFFKRFEKNLGGMSLAKHWDRCVALTSEPWIWLFSDDDLLDDNCVEAFYKFLETGGDATDIARFDGWMVDEHDKITGTQPFKSETETWLEFAQGYLLGCRRSLFTQQLVFRRTAHARAGGFLDFPLCWGTEYATVISMSRQRPLRRIPGARVFWRSSGLNLSPDRSARTRGAKLQACCLFVEWLHRQLSGPREHLFDGDDVLFRQALDIYLVQQITNEGFFPALANRDLLASTRAQIGGGSRLSLLKYLALAAVNDAFSVLGKTARSLPGRAE